MSETGTEKTAEVKEAAERGQGQRQRWNLLKMLCYLTYRLAAKHIPGRFSGALRRAVSRPLFKEAAGRLTIGRGADFGNGACLVMKDDASLGEYCSITGKGTVTIGRHVRMGYGCMIVTQNHRYLEEGYDGFDIKNTLIDDHALLGHRSIILPGVTIGKHAIIGAGAVVTKDIPDYAVAVGIPARVVKYRK